MRIFGYSQNYVLIQMDATKKEHQLSISVHINNITFFEFHIHTFTPYDYVLPTIVEGRGASFFLSLVFDNYSEYFIASLLLVAFMCILPHLGIALFLFTGWFRLNAQNCVPD